MKYMMYLSAKTKTQRKRMKRLINKPPTIYVSPKQYEALKKESEQNHGY